MTAAPRHPHPVLDRLREQAGLTDAGLARAIGMEPSDLGAVRREGRVPYRAIVAAVGAGTLRADLHYVFTGAAAPLTH